MHKAKVSLLLLVCSIQATNADIEFAPFKPSEQYKCGAFLQSRPNDRALSLYYQGIRQFVDWISQPFPHRVLLNNEALRGDVNELRDSLENKYIQWLDWQRGWLTAAAIILIIATAFPLAYVLYRCCVCCCGSSSRKQTTDSEYDGCKRNILNILLGILVFIDVLAASTLLMTGQYAEYGLEELPNRLNHCVDDLNLYKRDTDVKIRKLLIDDFSVVNNTLLDQISHAGHLVVDRVKKVSGAYAIDIFLNITEGAKEVRGVLREVSQQTQDLNEAASKFAVEFGRLRKTAEVEISQCTHGEGDALKTMCLQAQRLLDNIGSIKPEIAENIFADESFEALSRVADAEVTHLLQQSNSQFVLLENEIQKEIDKRSFSAQNMLKQIADDLFQVAEAVSMQIRQVNFDPLYQGIAMYNEEKYSDIKQYVHYSWYGTLVVTAVVMLTTFCFLFGMFYGVCGRRPTYYNDDCCVRSTGGSFFACGIWITILCYTTLAFIVTVLMLAFGNVTHLVCNPLDDPLSRPDMMSLVERYVEMGKQQENWAQSELGRLMDKRTPVEIVRACQRNETFYQMFDLDKQFHLADIKKFQHASIERLDKYLEQALEDLPIGGPIGNFVSQKELDSLHSLSDINITQLSSDGLEKIKQAIDGLDLMSKVNAFTVEADSMHAGRPQAVSSILEQVQDIDIRIAQPLRNKLEQLHMNLTNLDKRLQELQVPVSSLVGKLEHAQALLSQDVRVHLEGAARAVLKKLVETFDQYVNHVKDQIEKDVSSCVPVMDIARNSRAALCGHTVDHINGTWMTLLIILLFTLPIILMATTLKRLYNKMHAYPKYIVHEPALEHQMSSFVTDIYDARIKPGFSNYSYADDYHRTYR